MVWWVNDPSTNRSISFPTQKQAKSVSSNVQGSTVSRTPSAHHRRGCLLLPVALGGGTLALGMAAEAIRGMLG